MNVKNNASQLIFPSLRVRDFFAASVFTLPEGCKNHRQESVPVCFPIDLYSPHLDLQLSMGLFNKSLWKYALVQGKLYLSTDCIYSSVFTVTKGTSEVISGH